MNTVFVINGGGTTGKDTFCKYAMMYLNRHHLLTANISSIDEVKGYGRLLGWDGVKDEKGRKFLSDLKEISTRYDGPMKYMSTYIDNGGADVVFVHIREPDEIQKFVTRYPDASTILVKRDSVEKFSNSSDSNVDEYLYDHYVYNNGSEEDLKKTSEDLMNLVLISFT